jgi:hypothetical protein
MLIVSRDPLEIGFQHKTVYNFISLNLLFSRLLLILTVQRLFFIISVVDFEISLLQLVPKLFLN